MHPTATHYKLKTVMHKETRICPATAFHSIVSYVLPIILIVLPPCMETTAWYIDIYLFIIFLFT